MYLGCTSEEKMHTKKCITKWGTFMGKDEYHQSIASIIFSIIILKLATRIPSEEKECT